MKMKDMSSKLLEFVTEYYIFPPSVVFTIDVRAPRFFFCTCTWGNPTTSGNCTRCGGIVCY